MKFNINVDLLITKEMITIKYAMYNYTSKEFSFKYFQYLDFLINFY